MASDYGDDSGEKMLDGFTRLGERMGINAMYKRSDRLQRAFDDVNANTSAHEYAGVGDDRRVVWAKLDMTEFREAGGYDEIKRAIEAKLETRDIETAWFEDTDNGKEYLLFRISDAHDVWDSFDELSEEMQSATEMAAERLRGKIRDERPLEERAKEAREASAALEADRASCKAIDRESRFQELRSR